MGNLTERYEGVRCGPYTKLRRCEGGCRWGGGLNLILKTKNDREEGWDYNEEYIYVYSFPRGIISSVLIYFRKGAFCK